MIHAPIKAGIDTCTNVHWLQSVYVSNTKGAAIVIAVKAELRPRGRVEAEKKVVTESWASNRDHRARTT